jgi:hypothetical protein
MDLRVPCGWLFVILGAILIFMGIVTNARAPMTEINVNLYTGIAMAMFGGSMLWLARKSQS